MNKRKLTRKTNFSILRLSSYKSLDYGGIKEYYPRLPLSKKLKAYLVLLRPFTLLAPLLAGILGTLTPVEIITFEEFKIAVYVGVTLALLQASGQIVNQVIDAEMDGYTKPYRPIPCGLISKDEAMGVGILLLLFAISRGYWISFVFGDLILLLGFMAIFYSMEPLSPRKKNPYLNIFWLAISRGTLPVIVVWSIYGNILDAFDYIIIASLWVLAFQGTKDIVDKDVDKAFGIKTLANSTNYKVWALIVSSIMNLYILVEWIVWMFPLVILSIPTLIYLEKESKKFENTWGWILYYLGLGLFYLLMFLGERFG